MRKFPAASAIPVSNRHPHDSDVRKFPMAAERLGGILEMRFCMDLNVGKKGRSS
jgi:hypothetical protein